MSSHGQPVTWFSTAWGAQDQRRLGIKVGDHRHQTVVEALAILIAVKAWASRWATAPTTVIVKSDSMAALGAMEKGGTTGSAPLNTILKEMALVLACSETGLRLVFKHLPGSKNHWADALSRLTQPGSGARVPTPLLTVNRTDVEDRGEAFWSIGQAPEEVLQRRGEAEG